MNLAKNEKPANLDLAEFIKDVSWFFNPSDKIEIETTNRSLNLSAEFCQYFPKLSELMSKARVLSLLINGCEYKLFSWTTQAGKRCGWMNAYEKKANSNLPFLDEHNLLLNEIGGIKETYNSPEPSLCNNQEFLFLGSECAAGINAWGEYYEELCELDGTEKREYKSLLTFVREANGNVTVYEPKTKEVFLFATDHAYDNIEFLEGQPAYTFHRIHGVTNFKEYVELLAQEWLNVL